eukprot:CAMPEP_0117431502 /NCGR_PEP_ID=MMETSP0758-20121206/11025_1 /TAXON_ID=63605 /ORGANISM="Percolomonas cosmopolitus, Strain AE-1 (ATCC 50343)" /LENGTH=748 /DNA_ID=CAMNT_0005220553 /DNA_START=256 /DNA_END=2499 /DNA_ORIENTATION=+
MHVLVLTNVNNIYAWGNNFYGAIGKDTEYKNVYTPVQIDPIEFGYSKGTIVKIACGYSHSIALVESGKIYTWGSNDNGELGHSEDKKKVTVPEASAFDDIIDVAGGSQFTVALKEDKSFICFGNNYSGELGTNDEENFTELKVPLKDKDEHIFKIDCGLHHTLVLSTKGNVYGWGSNLQHALLPDRGEEDKIEPTQLKVQQILDIEAGEFLSMFLTQFKQVIRYGTEADMVFATRSFATGAGVRMYLNQFGILNINGNCFQGVKTVNLMDYKEKVDIKYYNGDYYFGALTSTGDVYTWGENRSGVLNGNITGKDLEYPARVDLEFTVKSMDILKTRNEVEVISMDNKVYRWGDNQNGIRYIKTLKTNTTKSSEQTENTTKSSEQTENTTKSSEQTMNTTKSSEQNMNKTKSSERKVTSIPSLNKLSTFYNKYKNLKTLKACEMTMGQVFSLPRNYDWNVFEKEVFDKSLLLPLIPHQACLTAYLYSVGEEWEEDEKLIQDRFQINKHLKYDKHALQLYYNLIVKLSDEKKNKTSAPKDQPKENNQQEMTLQLQKLTKTVEDKEKQIKSLQSTIDTMNQENLEKKNDEVVRLQNQLEQKETELKNLKKNHVIAIEKVNSELVNTKNDLLQLEKNYSALLDQQTKKTFKKVTPTENKQEKIKQGTTTENKQEEMKQTSEESKQHQGTTQKTSDKKEQQATTTENKREEMKQTSEEMKQHQGTTQKTSDKKEQQATTTENKREEMKQTSEE